MIYLGGRFFIIDRTSIAKGMLSNPKNRATEEFEIKRNGSCWNRIAFKYFDWQTKSTTLGNWCKEAAIGDDEDEVKYLN